jgi:delta(3,5)-delta(2,4)-dienoyl-CoA isomerase
VTKAAPYVFSVELNRPNKINNINKAMWEEVGEVFNKLDRNQECRVVILSAGGKMFSSGIDLSDLSQLASIVYSEDDIARKSMMMYQNIRHLQDLFTAIEKCSACVGAGVYLITTTDIRMCTMDAWFCVKEVDMGLAADVGTSQRLPKVIGSRSLVSDLCLTARRKKSQEVERCGLVSSVFQTKEEMMICCHGHGHHDSS